VRKRWYRKKTALGETGTVDTDHPGSVEPKAECEEALEMAKRLEIHFTPKHGSWLNMAEIELSALTSQCLNRRINNLSKLRKEIRAWQQDRNRNKKTIKWQFTTADARILLHTLYPVI
jgi:transposase